MADTAVDTRTRARALVAPDAPTLGAYLRRPGVRAAINARRAAARWRYHRSADDHQLRHVLAGVLLAHVEGVTRGRRLAAIAVDLHDLADRCAALQDMQDAELAAYIDAHEEPPAE